MTVQRARDYRQKAQECVEHAARVTNAEDKATWLQMAEGWQRMAENAERSGMIHADVDQIDGQEPEISN